MFPPLSPIPSLPPWGAPAESCSRGGGAVHTVGGESVCSPESVESAVDVVDLRRSRVTHRTDPRAPPPLGSGLGWENGQAPAALETSPACKTGTQHGLSPKVLGHEAQRRHQLLPSPRCETLSPGP